MDESIKDVKKRIGESYLGKRGIHGIGLSTQTPEILVYRDDTGDQDELPLQKELEAAAYPYSVRIVRSEPPALQ